MVTDTATGDRVLAVALIMVRKSIVAVGTEIGTVVGTTGTNSGTASGNVSGGFATDTAYREVGILGSALRWPLFYWQTYKGRPTFWSMEET